MYKPLGFAADGAGWQVWWVGLTLLIFIALANHAGAGSRLVGTVDHVRDGDTIEVSGVAIRLQGLHAPEPDELGGHASREAMIGLVLGRELECDLTGEQSYDRLIGQCWLDGQDIAALMVAMGHGRDCPRFSGGRYAAMERPDVVATMSLPDYCR